MRRCEMFTVLNRKVFVVAAIAAFLFTTIWGVSLAENWHSPVGVGITAADVVMEWNLLMLEMIKAKNIPNHFGNRTLAMVHIAMFDAINNIELKYTPFLVRSMQTRERPLWRRDIPRLISRRAAAASAAYTILSTLYPAEQAAFESLYMQQISLLANNPGIIPALPYGEQIGEAVLEWRQDDGSAQAASVPYPDGTELGEWRRTPPGYMAPMLPGWGAVTPFAMTRGDQFRLIGPPPLNSYEYARDYNEVMTIGAKNSVIRTPEQTTIARFWVAGIPTMWNLVARALVQQNQYDLIESARLFALLNVTSADANIVGWDMKYLYGYWRPVTAIEYGDADGNDGTIGEFGWESLIPAPAFPEYVSGHSTACGSAATLLAKFTGNDSFTFTLACEANQDLSDRTFHSFWEAACEAGISRIYGGIHFNFSNAEGLEAGRSLGRYVFGNFMIPLSE
jgi:hypothetical protein